MNEIELDDELCPQPLHPENVLCLPAVTLAETLSPSNTVPPPLAEEQLLLDTVTV